MSNLPVHEKSIFTSTQRAPLVVYSAEWCGDCQHLKAFLAKHDIEYENRDIVDNKSWGVELEQETGKLGVPYLRIDNEWIIGYEPGVGFNEDYARHVLADYIN